jgi:7-cyano-7-deazaguanine synthase
MVDVMRCDVTSDGYIAAKALGFKLSQLDEAIHSSVYTKLFPILDQSEKKAIILLSGGIDSATALFWAKKEGFDLIALSFNYFLRPKRENEASKRLTTNLGIKLIEVPIDFLREAIDSRIAGFPTPSAINSPEGFIPTRNLVFYSIAAYFAEVYGCKFIIGGHILTDTEQFSDASLDFFKSLEHLINKSKNKQDRTLIEILLPLIKLRKSKVVKLAKELNVPLELTWSCYSDGEEHCGRCSSCIKRKKALDKLNYLKTQLSL